MTTQNIKIDSKGRLQIPNSFRESLGIKEGENIVAHLDDENGRIILFPIEQKSKRLTIRFGDEPGALAKTATILAKNKVDLVYTSSRSLKRGKEAEWEIIADFSNSDTEKLKQELKNENGLKSFKFSQIEK